MLLVTYEWEVKRWTHESVLPSVFASASTFCVYLDAASGNHTSKPASNMLNFDMLVYETRLFWLAEPARESLVS